MLITFDETNFTVDVPERHDFLDALRGAAGSWSFASGKGAPHATVRAAGKRYRLISASGEGGETSAVGAACGTLAEVIEGFVAENPSRLCLHCAAVELGGRLVVFPNTYRAGKSTLVARLAASGHRVFGDDVLPLSDGDANGVALGLAPRLRLPLPETASDALRAFVTKHAGPGDGYYQYLSLPPALQAMRGAELPLGAIVLLDRRSTGPASMHLATRSSALRALITRNFARAAPAGELLERLYAIMARVPILKLRYSDLDDAAAQLADTFAVWPARLDGILADRSEVCVDADGAEDMPAIDLAGLLLRQNPSVTLRAEDGEVFLAHADGTSIHHLNQVGAGLWHLLADPVAEAEAVEVLAGAFPEADAGILARDVRGLFSALLAGGFIIAAPDQR